MCLTLKCPWNVMYSILAGSFHTGKVLSWVSQRQSQPPASCWNQRNHKNVTASVIIPPCCLNACPEKKKSEAACFSLSHTLTHSFTGRHTCMFSCLQDKQILPGSHIHKHMYTHNTSAQTNTSTRQLQNYIHWEVVETQGCQAHRQ